MVKNHSSYEISEKSERKCILHKLHDYQPHKVFFTKFLYIKYCLYDSIKILTPYKTCTKGFWSNAEYSLNLSNPYLVGTSTLTKSIRMKCFRANLILGVHCLMFLSWIELSFLVFLIFEATWPVTSMDGWWLPCEQAIHLGDIERGHSRAARARWGARDLACRLGDDASYAQNVIDCY